MPHYSTFVLRILLDSQNSLVEGQITHVASQNTVYFRDLGKATAFIEHHLEHHTEHRTEQHLDPSSETPQEGTLNGTTSLPKGKVCDADSGKGIRE